MDIIFTHFYNSYLRGDNGNVIKSPAAQASRLRLVIADYLGGVDVDEITDTSCTFSWVKRN